MENGETVVLDGNGYSIKGKTGTPGVQVSGSGTLQMQNVVVAGGDGVYDVNGAVAVQVNGDVDVVLSGMVNMTGGKAGSYLTILPGGDKPESYSGLNGMNFKGNRLIVSEGSNVSVSGSDAYEGEDAHPGYEGGDGLEFSGNRFLVEAGAVLTLTGGNGESTYGGNALYMSNGLFYTGNGATLNLVGGSGVTAENAGKEIDLWVGYVPDRQLLTENGCDNLHKTTIKCLAGTSSTETDYYHLFAQVANSLLDGEPWRIENYAFDGWYEDAGTTKAYDFKTPVTGAKTLYAKWNKNTYTVTFDAQGGSTVAAQKAAYGETVKTPAKPTRKGCVFGGGSVR